MSMSTAAFGFPPALRERRFVLYWLGLMLSVAGSRMQFWGLLWHVRTLSDQPIALGVVGLVRVVPIVFFSLIGGAIADAFDRRKVLLVVESLLLANAAALGWLTAHGHASLAWLYLLTALQGGIFAFELPARQALVPNLVKRDDLPGAFSLQSIAFQMGSILGPMLSGLVIAYAGQAWVYYANAASYLALIAALVLIGPVPQARRPLAAKRLRLVDAQAIAEGVRFILGQPIILSSMLLDFFATFFASANALLPIFARDIWQVGEVGYGWLAASASIGAALASLLLAFVKTLRRQGALLLWSVVVFGLATVAFGLAPSPWLGGLALAVTGAADTVSMVIRNTIRQLQTPDELRGRMTSVNQIFFVGGPQLGELEAGLAAQFLGAPLAVITGGIGCVLAVGWVAQRWPQLARYNGDEPVLAGA